MKPTWWRHLRASSPRERDGQDECTGYFAAGLTKLDLVCTAPGLRTWIVAMSSAIDLLPAVDVIEQFCLGTLRAHQCRLDLVFLEQAEKILRFHQAAGGVVIDKEFFTVEFGAAVFRDASSEFQSKGVRQSAARASFPVNRPLANVGKSGKKPGFCHINARRWQQSGCLKQSNDGHFARFEVR
jgi:hypothetical protein